MDEKNREPDKTDTREGIGFFRKLLRWAAQNVFGLGITFLVFLALPFLQIVANFGKKDMEVRTVAVVEPPPPPPEVLEEPPPPEPEPEPEPEMQPDTSQNLSLSDLQLMLNPGGGGGAGGQLLNEALSDAMKGASEAFSGMSIEQKPRPVYQPPPKYPRELFKAGVSGVVTVEGVVGVDGKVRNLRAIGSYPHPALRDAAIAAVSKWRFEPGVRDGAKAPFKIQIPVKFALG